MALDVAYAVGRSLERFLPGHGAHRIVDGDTVYWCRSEGEGRWTLAKITDHWSTYEHYEMDLGRLTCTCRAGSTGRGCKHVRWCLDLPVRNPGGEPADPAAGSSAARVAAVLTPRSACG